MTILKYGGEMLRFFVAVERLSPAVVERQAPCNVVQPEPEQALHKQQSNRPAWMINFTFQFQCLTGQSWLISFSLLLNHLSTLLSFQMKPLLNKYLKFQQINFMYIVNKGEKDQFLVF